MDVKSFAYWLAFLVAGICGLLLAWLSTKYKPAAAALVVAGWTGFNIGSSLSNLLYF